MADITCHVEEATLKEKVKDGVAAVYCPHTTAGLLSMRTLT